MTSRRRWLELARPASLGLAVRVLSVLPLGLAAACGTGLVGGAPADACVHGATEFCHPSPALAGKGACRMGERQCVYGTWSDCLGAVLPKTEACETVEDDDCDGLMNEGCPCAAGTTRACYTGGAASEGKGACKAGEAACVDGVWAEACAGEVVPSSQELCDGADDDCDGSIDEGCTCDSGTTEPCYPFDDATRDVGACKAGLQSCGNTNWGECVGAVGPAPESCNGVDDDCDGATDEENPGGGAACSSGNPKACGPGAFVCVGGKVVCVEGVAGGVESCNGVDDDCDGSIDEGNPGGGGTCSTGAPGACDAGLRLCSFGKLVCAPTTSGSPESCNGEDDDCDGLIDQGDPGGGAACDTGAKGACAAGVIRCTGGALGCVANVGALVEQCNGVDDDCDGLVDQGDPGGGAGCETGALGACAAGTLRCVTGVIQCVPKALPVTEQCNGVDDDCDGAIDQGNPGGGQSCSTGLLGPCGTGETACTAGALACNQTFFPKPEFCNAFDDDCNGVEDDAVIDCPGQCNFGSCFGDLP